MPSKLLKAGVKDMVRLSDARISRTSFGTLLVHTSPESAIGGPLAAVRDGDSIELDVNEGRIELLVAEAEMKKRLADWRPREPRYPRGYGKMFLDRILQAHEGGGFDFLRGAPGDEPRPRVSN